MAPEGKIILLPLLAVAALLAGWWIAGGPALLRYLALVATLLLLFSLWFFRDPSRTLPDDPLAMISPADGKVVQQLPIGVDPDLGVEAVQLSIFLSVFNVHVQKVPFDATVIQSRYNRGKFLAAFNHKASLDNEQSQVLFESAAGKFKVKQIAGLIARRILNYMDAGQTVARGQRLGYIRFGSRVDVIVPATFNFAVEVGDKVKAGETVIGHFGQ